MNEIVYVDTSALLKQYIEEKGSLQTVNFLREAGFLGASVLVKVEFVAGIAKASRMQWIDADKAQMVVSQYNEEVANLQLIAVDHAIVTRAANLAWEYNLRGYDAIHLASALQWQEDLREAVTLATFDRQLWEVARKVNLATWPLKIDFD